MYEAKLKKLTFIPKPLVKEGIKRLEQYAFIMCRTLRAKHTNVSKIWKDYAKRMQLIQKPIITHNLLYSFFSISFKKDKGFVFQKGIERYVDPKLLSGLPSFKGSFGEPKFTDRSQSNEKPITGPRLTIRAIERQVAESKGGAKMDLELKRLQRAASKVARLTLGKKKQKGKVPERAIAPLGQDEQVRFLRGCLFITGIKMVRTLQNG